MLAVWRNGAFSCGMPCVSKSAAKIDVVEWCGVDSTRGKKTPIKHRVRLGCEQKNYCFQGKLDGKSCIFKIDTGSDVSIISKRMVRIPRKEVKVKNSYLIYLTGEKIPVKSKVKVSVELGKFVSVMSMFVADMEEDCILGLDFLSATNAESKLQSVLGLGPKKKKRKFVCLRINYCERVPDFLLELFERDSKGLNSDQKKKFAELLTEFQDIFSEDIIAGNCDILQHKIHLSDSRPIKQVPRRIPFGMRREVEENLIEMREKGIIEESSSPWVSPAVMVKKKDGTLRFCVDFRKLNAKTIKDSYPIPRIDDTLDCLAGNAWFSTLDLKSGYWQVKIRPEDREKTAFSVGKGLWQFTVLPFGLCNAPATFERLMELVLQKLISKVCLVYLDDVIVFSKTFDEMIQSLRAVLLRFRAANLKLNPKKCVLLGQTVKFLGHVVSEKGVTTDPEKIIAVKDWPIPQTKKQLRSFLGFCSYYRKFVKGFSLIAKPLYSLTESQSKFIWTKQMQESFEKLKGVLVSSIILTFPNEEGKFILDTDASNDGMGAVLSQVQGKSEKVIAYYSRVFSKTERNYCVTRRELLAVVDSIKCFHHYLYGRNFVVRSDHISLKWLMSFKDLEGQLARWMERLQQYDFEIQYRKGNSHHNADGLSRRPCEFSSCNYCRKVEEKVMASKIEKVGRIVFEDSQRDWRREQLEDKVISIFLLAKEQNQRPSWHEISLKGPSARIYWNQWDALLICKGILYKKWESASLIKQVLQIVVPQKVINEILKEAHDAPSSGHFGINKTLARIRRNFYWSTCKKDVEDWCRTCEICVSKAGPSDKGKSPLQIFNVGAPFDRVQMDILGPLPVSTYGNKYLLVIIDCFSKWVEAIPLKNIRASSVAEAFVSQVVSRHGVPLEIHTDQGKCFESKLFQELSQLIGTKKTRTTALHPQSDGQVERQQRTILEYLSKFVSSHQKDWDRWIPMSLLAYRSSRHETMKFTPSELYFAQNLRIPLDLFRGFPPEEEEFLSEESYVSKLRKKLDKIQEMARNFMTIKSEKVKSSYDKKARDVVFLPGQKVWLFNPRRSRGKTPKLQRNWEGPYEIVKRLSDVVYCIQLSPRHRKKVIHADRLASFRKRK